MKIIQEANASYDDQNRLTEILDNKRFKVTYKYDQNDNLVYNGSQVFKHDGLDLAVNIGWYQYDELNRATISHANVDAAGTDLELGNSGQKISYDTAGRRIGIETTADKTDFKYDANGHLSEIRVNDLVKSKRTVAKDGTILASTEWGDYKTREKRVVGTQDSHWGDLFIYEYYDKYHTKKIRDESYGYNQYGEKTTINDLMNAGDKTSITFDANGNQLQRSVTNDGKTNTSTFAYEKWDSYKQQSTTQPFDSGHKKIQDTIGLQHYQYDANGNVKDLQDATGRRSFEYITDINGQVLSRSESEYNTDTKVWENKRQNFFYFDGRTIGEAGDFTSANKDFVRMNSEAAEGFAKKENIKTSDTALKGQGAQKDQQSANFTFGYGGVNPYTSSVGYTTNVEGETAKTIAQSVYGDSSLWHVIAEANGISGTDGLPKGTSIRVPEAVYSVKSTAQNLGVTQGDTLGNAQPLVPDSPRINDGSWDNEIQLAITIVIEVVAVVATVYAGGPASGAAAYATVKQIGNNAAGRQDGWNWGQFAYDAVSYYAASGVGGTASGVKQVAITATTKAAVDHGFSQATDGKYGQDFTWENYLTSFATSAIAPQSGGAKSDGIWTTVGKKLGNSAASGLVNDTIRRNTYGSYDADKETGLNFLERTLQSTSTSLANDLGEALSRSSLKSYYGDEEGQRRYDAIKKEQKQPSWIDSTLDFLGIIDLPTTTEQPKNALTAEQKDNEALGKNTRLLNLRTAQAAIGDDPGSRSDVAVLGRQGLFSGDTTEITLEDVKENQERIESGLGTAAEIEAYNTHAEALSEYEEPSQSNDNVNVFGAKSPIEVLNDPEGPYIDVAKVINSLLPNAEIAIPITDETGTTSVNRLLERNELEGEIFNSGLKSDNTSAISISGSITATLGDAKLTGIVTEKGASAKAGYGDYSINLDTFDIDAKAGDVQLRKINADGENTNSGTKLTLSPLVSVIVDNSKSVVPAIGVSLDKAFSTERFGFNTGVSGSAEIKLDLNQGIRNFSAPYRQIDNLFQRRYEISDFNVSNTMRFIFNNENKTFEDK